MTLSNRDNTLATIFYEKADYVPMTSEAFSMTGIGVSSVTDCPLADGTDMFGVPWKVTHEGAMPQPGFVMFDDIADWEKHTHVPDLDSIDVKALAAADIERRPPDRENKLVQIMRPTGIFQRLVAMMGFENALVALISDPESCMDYFDVVSDYMVRYNDAVIDAYGPDVYIYSDDISTANSTFMSVDTYEEVIAPFHRRIAEGIRKHEGVVAEYHECGLSEPIIPLLADMGFQMWHSANPKNDMMGLMDGPLAGKMAVEGGWDPHCPASYLGASVELLEEETRRCMNAYKRPGYIFLPFVLNERGNSMVVGDERMPNVKAVWDELRWF